MKRWMPSPPLSAALFVVWLLLNQSLEAATLLAAAVLAVVVPLLTASLRPARVRMRNPLLALRLLGHVIHDMVVSARDVALVLVTRHRSEIRSYFVHVPLRLRDPNGLAVLAMIFCVTPGTAWGELARDRSVLLVHVLGEEDPEAFIQKVRDRYEQPLMEIFEAP